MAKFLTPLRVEKVENSDDEWKVLEDFSYQSDIGGLITIPAGFITDFASTPQIVWNILPKDGRWDSAALVHDFLYNTHKFERSKCDAIFKEALTVLKVNFMARWEMYLGVRLGGWAFWK